MSTAKAIWIKLFNFNLSALFFGEKMPGEPNIYLDTAVKSQDKKEKISEGYLHSFSHHQHFGPSVYVSSSISELLHDTDRDFRI